MFWFASSKFAILVDILHKLVIIGQGQLNFVFYFQISNSPNELRETLPNFEKYAQNNRQPIFSFGCLIQMEHFPKEFWANS